MDERPPPALVCAPALSSTTGVLTQMNLFGGHRHPSSRGWCSRSILTPNIVALLFLTACLRPSAARSRVSFEVLPSNDQNDKQRALNLLLYDVVSGRGVQRSITFTAASLLSFTKHISDEGRKCVKFIPMTRDSGFSYTESKYLLQYVETRSHRRSTRKQELSRNEAKNKCGLQSQDQKQPNNNCKTKRSMRANHNHKTQDKQITTAK